MCGRFAWIALVLLSSTLATAQAVTGTVDVRVTTADGVSPAGAIVEAVPDEGPGARVSAVVAAAEEVVTLAAPARTVRIRVSLAGYQPASCLVTARYGEAAVVLIRLARIEASTAVVQRRPPLSYGTGIERRLFTDLPTSGTTWSLLETADPWLIADRVDAGGQWPGEPARLGGQGTSATQTLFRIDGLDVSDPQVTGAPTIDPSLAALDAVVVQSATVDPSAAGPGPVVDLVLRRPATMWSGDARVMFAPPGLQSAAGAIAPRSRLQSGGDGSVSAGGPLGGPQLGLFASGRVARAQRVEREAETLEPAVGSGMLHLVAAPKADSEVRALVSFVQADRPFAARARFADRGLTERNRGVAAHTYWETLRGGGAWTLAAAWQHGDTHADVPAGAAGGLVERLRDGPPLALVAAEDSTRTRWEVQAGLASAPVRWLGRRHLIGVGGSIGGAALTSRGSAQPAFGELVNGRPARVWDVTVPVGASRRSAWSVGGFVSDRIDLANSLTMTAALRVDADRGRAEGAPNGISWFTATPRLALRWLPAESFVITTGYAWYGHRLPLSDLAVGDPGAPAGVMYRWDDRNADRRYTPPELTAVAAVGGCCGSSSTIDADLRRPVTGEFRIGFEQAIGAWRWGVTGLDRRERHLVALVDTGVTAAGYTVRTIEDPGVDIAGLSGFTSLPIYDRRRESFLQDAYLLTNTTAAPTRYQGLDVTVARDLGDRWLVRFGGSAYLSEGVGAGRGYRADENDQGILGEAFTTPNAETNARGRLFYDRAFVMKVLAAYHGRGPLGASVVARYQDGQPFARLVVADGLAQGAEAIQAYPRGGQRFTYTLTLDARVELRWRIGGRAVGLAVEAFNLPNMALEAEEDIVTGPAFRTVTAVQPPRVVRVGLQLGF